MQFYKFQTIYYHLYTVKHLMFVCLYFSSFAKGKHKIKMAWHRYLHCVPKKRDHVFDDKLK